MCVICNLLIIEQAFFPLCSNDKNMDFVNILFITFYGCDSSLIVLVLQSPLQVFTLSKSSRTLLLYHPLLKRSYSCSHLSVYSTLLTHKSNYNELVHINEIIIPSFGRSNKYHLDRILVEKPWVYLSRKYSIKL
jgi:hypothetical protein